MRTLSLFLLLACTGEGPLPPAAPAGLVLNELMTHNRSALADPDAAGCAEHDPWLELFNRDDDPVPLAGWTVGPTRATAAELPDLTLDPGAHLLLWADGSPAQGPTHLTLSLHDHTGPLHLFTPEGEPHDTFDVPALADDESWGRLTDGGPTTATQFEPTPGAANTALQPDPCLLPTPGFDDHTYPCLSTLDGYRRLAASRVGTEVVKFAILDFQRPQQGNVRYFDGAFYDLHDEYYIFRTLNGQPFPSDPTHQPFPGTFADVDAIYTWARTVDLESLFDRDVLRWAGERLTSQRYYQLALTAPRAIGLGTIVHLSATPTAPERWGFDLAYSDPATAAELTVYLQRLTATLPPAIADQLHWVVRSAAQEQTARAIEGTDHPLADRILRYTELSEPGEVQVYNPGLAAGRLRVVRAGESPFTGASDQDVLVLAEIPDELPPCAALITAVPQTPLSHVALLARSRGIPNLHIAGILDDPAWNQWERVRAHLALAAEGDQAHAVDITSAEAAAWRALRTTPPPDLPPLITDGLPWTVDVTALDPHDMPSQRPVIGGKAAGFVALTHTPGLDVPDLPLAITVRAFQAHLDQLPEVPTLLQRPEFTTGADAAVRYLVLEGEAAYRARYPDTAEAALTAFYAARPADDLLVTLAREGGLRRRIERTPPPPAALAAIEDALHDRFAWLDPEQGLRFRSSSTIEDLEGFNGAGLYTSTTGFLHAEQQGEDRTVATALSEVWASYWGAEAFEERHRAGIDHLAGGMGLIVHARFDDDQELNNSVATLTHLPSGTWELVVNTQRGPLSVTNPPPAADCRPIEPEISLVTGTLGAGALTRVRPSSEVAPGVQVLDDAALLTLFDDLIPLGELWLDIENAGLPEPQHRQIVTLDLELRTMAPGWPAGSGGTTTRHVVKQARSLDPSLAAHSEEVQALPFPRDVLARARTVERLTCEAEAITVTAWQLTTNPTVAPDAGYSSEPLVGQLLVDLHQPLLGLPAGGSVLLDHTQLVPPTGSVAPWRLTAEVVHADVAAIDLWSGERWRLDGESGVLEVCVTEVLSSSPDDFLRGLMGR